MKTLGDVLKLAGGYLKEKKIERSQRVAEDLLASLLKIKRLDLYLQFDKPLKEEELTLFREMILRRSQGEPLEYILGEMEFYGCHLKITKDVLIPRPETEILLDKICKNLEEWDLNRKVAWDVCTGSGCLALGLKKKFSCFNVIASDLSIKSLNVAKRNADLNNLEVSFLQGDLLAPFAKQKADIVLINPPYVSQKEYEALDREVREFEPKMALVGGESGLEFYERLAKELPFYLNSKAKVFFEIGFNQGEKITTFFSSSCWREKFFEKDFSGHDRFFFLEFE